MHPVNVRCLLHQYGSFNCCPQEITAKILETEALSMNEVLSFLQCILKSAQWHDLAPHRASFISALLTFLKFAAIIQILLEVERGLDNKPTEQIHGFFAFALTKEENVFVVLKIVFAKEIASCKNHSNMACLYFARNSLQARIEVLYKV